MNIEQTKKMNFMIKELTKTGTASTFDDAVAMAGNMYEEGLPERPSTVVISETTDRMRELVDKRIRHHVSSITEQVNAELTRLWQAVEEVRQRSPEKPEPKDIDTTKELPAAKTEPEVVKTKHEEAKTAHPRNGSFGSEDVSLEKFFYFGDK